MREGGVVGDDATESGRDVKRSSRMETAQAQSEEKRGDVHMQSSEQRGSCGEETVSFPRLPITSLKIAA